jgi:hypothetical protein
MRINVMLQLFISTSCHRRWHQFLKPRSEGYKNHDWTVDEVMMLDDHNDDNFRDDQYDSNDDYDDIDM